MTGWFEGEQATSWGGDALDAEDRVRYDPMTETYHAYHDRENPDPLCLTIIKAVAAVTGREPTALDTLYPVLDPDALDALMGSARETNVQVTFTYEDCTISVAASGDIVVDPDD